MLSVLIASDKFKGSLSADESPAPSSEGCSKPPRTPGSAGSLWPTGERGAWPPPARAGSAARSSW